MSMKRDPQKFIDPAVSAVMDDAVYGGMERARMRRSMTPGKRRKADRDARRVRATYDLPEQLIERLEKVAAQESLPVSQVAAFYLLSGLEGRPLEMIKRPSRSPRFDWVLELPEI